MTVGKDVLEVPPAKVFQNGGGVAQTCVDQIVGAPRLWSNHAGCQYYRQLLTRKTFASRSGHPTWVAVTFPYSASPPAQLPHCPQRFLLGQVVQLSCLTTSSNAMCLLFVVKVTRGEREPRCEHPIAPSSQHIHPISNPRIWTLRNSAPQNPGS